MSRVALFVDADNLSPDCAPTLLALSADLRRAYGRAEALKGWKGRGFRLMMIETAKNSADILLTIEAMEAALTGGFDQVVIASSDSDFTHLARRLREIGLRVIGYGNEQAANGFGAACHEFRLLSPQALPDATEPVRQAPEPVQLSRVEADVRAILKAEGGSMPLWGLNPRLRQDHPFQITGTPEGNWRAWLLRRSHLFHVGPKGPDCRVSLVKPN